MVKASDNEYPSILMAEQGSTPATPASTNWRLFIDEADGLLKTVDDGGNVDIVGGGATGFDISGLTIEHSIQGVSDYVGGYDDSAADERGFPIGQFAISRQHSVIFSECFATGAIANASLVESNGGLVINLSSGTVASVTGTVNHPGIIRLGTSTATNGRCCIGNVNNTDLVLLGGGKARFGVVMKIATLSGSGQTFYVRGGLMDGQVSDPTDGVFFRYTDTVNSGKWEGVCRQNGTETARDTTISADTNWHTFEAEVNAAGNSCQFYIDGSAVGAAVTTNIPTGTGRETTLIPAAITKTAGGTERTLDVDAFWYIFEFTTAR